MLYVLYVILFLVLINVASVSRVGFKAFQTKRQRHKIAAARSTQIPFNKSGSGEHILVLGDSTMHGYGVEDPANTIGGLLAQRYPKDSVETVADNGARLADLDTQFSKAQYEQYKLIFLGIGGNDVLQITPFQTIEERLERFLKKVSARSDKIILVHCVNLGHTGVFAFPLNYLFDYRTRRLSETYTKVAKKYPTVHYVSFYRPIGNDFYTRKTRLQFIASDGFHPSDYANKFFFKMTEEFLP